MGVLRLSWMMSLGMPSECVSGVLFGRGFGGFGGLSAGDIDVFAAVFLGVSLETYETSLPLSWVMCSGMSSEGVLGCPWGMSLGVSDCQSHIWSGRKSSGGFLLGVSARIVVCVVLSDVMLWGCLWGCVSG